jgi:hypothetical protein
MGAWSAAYLLASAAVLRPPAATGLGLDWRCAILEAPDRNY